MKSHELKYVSAVAVILLALWLQYILWPVIGDKSFLLLYPAVFVCALMWGRSAGMLAVLVASFGACYIFIPPHYSLLIDRMANVFNLAVFATTGIGASMFSGHFHKIRLQEAKAHEALKEASLAKNQFFANVSHEMRAPLGIMVGYAELALTAQKITPREVREYLEMIVRNGRQLADVIRDVLDLSKAEAGRLEPESNLFSLRSLLQEVVTMFEGAAKSKGVSLDLEIPETLPKQVCTDQTMLRQILINLVSNAVKFTNEGYVKMTAVMTPPPVKGQEMAIKVTVEDTGLGLSPEQRKKLFKPYSQVDSSKSRKHGGTGLGLTLAQQFAWVLGGDIVLEKSSPGHGSTFTLVVEGGVFDGLYDTDHDQSESQGAQVYTEAEAVQYLAGRRAVLVEDSKEIQLIVGRTLSNAGMAVELASDGREGLEKILANQCDLVLMDLQMPIMDGYETTAELRQRGFEKPIVALTAHALKEERERALSQGFNAYLTKPLSRKTLLESLAGVLQSGSINPNDHLH